MSLNTVFLLAWRYFSNTYASSLRTMVGVCTASIFIGTFSLALIASIMRGFEFETHKTLQSIYPSLIIQAPAKTTLCSTALQTHIKNNFRITDSTPYTMTEGLIRPATTDEPAFVVTVKSIEPKTESRVTALNTMTLPAQSLHNLQEQHIALGKNLALQLGVNVGDQVMLTLPEDLQINFKDAQLIEIPVTVAGTINTGIAEYDEYLVVIHLSLAKKIWGENCITHIGISVPSGSNETTILADLQSLPDVQCYSWKKLYPALVSSLKLEQYVMFFLLLLITLVASMNMVSLLFMLITAKRTDIALLKMLGMPTWHIHLLFLLVSIIITMIAAVIGLSMAYATGIFLQSYPFITLPSEIYFITTLPVKLEWSTFAIVFAAVLFLSITASLLPLRSIKRMNCTETIRFE